MQQQTLPQQQHTEQPAGTAYVETPFFKVSFEHMYEVVGICVILIVCGLIKKYLWK